MGIRIKPQNLHVRVLSYCLVPLQCKATCLQMVGLVLVLWHIFITLNSMSIFQVVCCLWVDHVITVIISQCSLSKKSQQTSQPHHTHFCIAFVYLLMFCQFFLTFCLVIKLLNLEIQLSSCFCYSPIFCVREMTVESYWIFSNFRCFAAVLWFLLYKLCNLVTTGNSNQLLNHCFIFCFAEH